MTKAPYIVYTPDKDFVLEKDDISGGGGSGGGVFIIESEETENAITLKKTWKEIKDAYISGKQCIVVLKDEAINIEVISIVTAVKKATSSYSVYISGDGVSESEVEFEAESENDYPIGYTD